MIPGSWENTSLGLFYEHKRNTLGVWCYTTHHLTVIRISGICSTYPTVEQHTGEGVVEAADLHHNMLKMIVTWTVFILVWWRISSSSSQLTLPRGSLQPSFNTDVAACWSASTELFTSSSVISGTIYFCKVYTCYLQYFCGVGSLTYSWRPHWN